MNSQPDSDEGVTFATRSGRGVAMLLAYSSALMIFVGISGCLVGFVERNGAFMVLGSGLLLAWPAKKAIRDIGRDVSRVSISRNRVQWTVYGQQKEVAISLTDLERIEYYLDPEKLDSFKFYLRSGECVSLDPFTHRHQEIFNHLRRVFGGRMILQGRDVPAPAELT